MLVQVVPSARQGQPDLRGQQELRERQGRKGQRAIRGFKGRLDRRVCRDLLVQWDPWDQPDHKARPEQSAQRVLLV